MADWSIFLLCLIFTMIGAICASAPLALWYYRHNYLERIIRIFEEKPLFIIPRGKPVPGAEEVKFISDGKQLIGCYLRARKPRKGVILFGLEFGSDRWSAWQYCANLCERGYDVFTYEPRNQGQSEADPHYAPMQWVTDHDRRDMVAALSYLKTRKDVPATGIGIFGISKGGSVALSVAAEDPWIRCVVTDGAYATYTTIVPFMRRWVGIYVATHPFLRRLAPDWFYGRLGLAAVNAVAKRRGLTFLHLEKSARKLREPVLMIHGGNDTYIKPEMAVTLHGKIGSRVSELWVVPKAKHNQAMHIAGDEYTRRIAAFLDEHLAPLEVGVESDTHDLAASRAGMAVPS